MLNHLPFKLLIIIMFEHLFVSYENVTPPPKNEESEEKEITLT
jgi:hypothetical protein